ncbi:hypothetical protein [Brevibacterium linens]|uniref:Uncharacterized protein n=1 Tax=Brevibacterium linens TaxID=1703 RepID=A0A2H1JZE3_BRELN|nr:hypothetical protein [Brevibacterium linens]AZU00397.1 hypothetical protein CXR29_06485 [Brevibacterium linens]SMX92422.1 hypothetical protein BLIN101_02795 [Brevibacterium linens]
MDDRIDALLADIEAADSAAQAHARRGEFGDEVAGQAAERTLLERLRGSLGSTVQVTMSDRDITGAVCFLGRDIVVLAGAEVSAIAFSAVCGLRVTTRVHRFEAGGLERLGMGSALRRWSEAHEEVSIDVAGRSGGIRGRCSLVAADYVEISGRIIPFAAISAIHARTNPFG